MEQIDARAERRERKRNFKPLGFDDEPRVREALEICGGRRDEASELLGISRTTLYRKCVEFGIEKVGKTKVANFEEVKREILKQLTEEESQ